MTTKARRKLIVVKYPGGQSIAQAHKLSFLRDKRVLIGLSGGINSAAVLCWLATQKEDYRPRQLFLYYAHFEEHSPGTKEFVHTLVDYAKTKFEDVFYEETQNSVLDFFREKGMIPHPMLAPCTQILKIEPMYKFKVQNNIDFDLVGYVREEKRRITNMLSKHESRSDYKLFPISKFTNEWCFEIVKQEIGSYPAIYDIVNEKGKRVFHHNNCLPCKNMNMKDFEAVEQYYPEYFQKALNLSEELEKHWGREKDEFNTRFGLNDENTHCSICQF